MAAVSASTTSAWAAAAAVISTSSIGVLTAFFAVAPFFGVAGFLAVAERDARAFLPAACEPEVSAISNLPDETAIEPAVNGPFQTQ